MKHYKYFQSKIVLYNDSQMLLVLSFFVLMYLLEKKYWLKYIYREREKRESVCVYIYIYIYTHNQYTQYCTQCAFYDSGA